MLSVENFRSLNTPELCKWLRQYSGLNDLEPALDAIVHHKIRGVNFLDLEFNSWLAIGVIGGTANSFVQLARGIKQGGSFFQERKKTPLEIIKGEMTTPSSFSQHQNAKGWVCVLHKHPELICHRNVMEESSIPLCLLNPVFAQFVYDLDHIAVTSQDCEFVHKLTNTMCGAFPREDERMTNFIELFHDYTNMKLLQMAYSGSFTDGSMCFRNGTLYCNLEVKVEKGCGGGDPYMQSIAYYVKSLPNDAESIQYPCFLLELCGTAFSVNGIVNAGIICEPLFDVNAKIQIISEPLSPTYQLLCNQNFFMTGKITRLFASLRKSLNSLYVYMDTPENILRACSFPYITSFYDPLSNEYIAIKYEKRIKGLVFEATVVEKEMEDVIVKFCSRYSHDVHNFCYSMQSAPALLSIRHHGDYIMVVMEKLPLIPLSREDYYNVDIRSQVQYILDRLREQKYVHGDMRDNNVMIDTNRNKVILLDFDWAGIDGVDVYPPCMNSDIKWPEGASTGQPLLHAHDCYWWQ